MKALDIPLTELEEWSDNPFKRSQIPDRDLENSIAQSGVLQPLAVIPNGDDRYIVIDGNRRLRIARRLGVGALTCNVYEHVQDPVRLAITLNTTGKPWDTQTLGQLIADHPGALAAVQSPLTRGKIYGASHLMGDEYKEFIKYYTLSAYDLGMQVAKYLGRRKDEAFCRKTVVWLGRHRLSYIARFALKMRIPPGDFERAIENDKPLKVVVMGESNLESY